MEDRQTERYVKKDRMGKGSHLPTLEASSLRSVDSYRTRNTRNFPILKADTPSDNYRGERRKKKMANAS